MHLRQFNRISCSNELNQYHYFNNNKDVTGKVFVDVGCAEGYSSLEIIEEAKHVYLFEQNESWLEAIRATFEPWKDKVTIVQKYRAVYGGV